MSKHRLDDNFAVVARSPFELHYEGPASVVTAINRIGPFDILPGHADFFSMLTPGEVIIEPANGETIKIQATNGIITVHSGKVSLFLNM